MTPMSYCPFCNALLAGDDTGGPKKCPVCYRLIQTTTLDRQPITVCVPSVPICVMTSSDQ